jgi:NAD(P)H-dependent FMN reductase
MSHSPTVGFICASLREGSINQKLESALIPLARDIGLSPEKIDLNDYELPLFHGDTKPPAAVQDLIDRMKSFDAIVIVTPEYNGSLPPLLKNAIDWTSTISTDHITGPTYGIASCAPGPMSGIMCMRQVQYILTRLGAEVVPTQVGVGMSAQAFDENGHLNAGRSADLAVKMLTALKDRTLQKRSTAA